MSNIALSQNGRVSTTDMIMGDGNLDKIKGFSNLMSGSNMVPQHFKGNTYDCAIVVAKAISMGFDPVAMSQEVFPISGKMTYGSKLIIGMIHNSGLVEPRTFTQEIGDWSKLQIRKGQAFHGNEEGLGVKVGFKYIGDSEPTFGSVLYLEPQTIRNSPLWKTDPMQQLVYLAAKRWTSVNMPAVTMGMMTEDEVKDESKPERDITPQAPSMVNPESEVVNFSSAEVKYEEQVDIEEYIEEQSVEQVVEQPVEPKGPQAGDLDSEGNEFEPDFMTGTTLKDGTWRLNKAGQERKRKQDEAEQAEQPAEEPVAEPVAEQVAEQSILVKAVHEESIDMLGGEGPFKVVTFDYCDSLVEVEGHESNWLPISSDDVVYLEIANPSVDEASLKTKESLDAALNQTKAVTLKLKGKVELINSEDLIEEALDVIDEWESNAKSEINKVAIKGNKATEGDFKHLTEVNTNYWNEALKAVKHFQEKDEEQDSPFGA